MEKLRENSDRCGEICLSRNGILFFVCCLCDQNYKDYKEYSEHITSEHNLQFSSWENERIPLNIEETIEYIDFELLTEDVQEVYEIEESTIIDESEEIAYSDDANSTCEFNNEKLQKPSLEEDCQKKEILRDKENEGFKCPHCTKIIKSKGNFDKHVLRHSEQNKRYACKFDNCSKRFHQRSELMQHERSHTGERPFVCDYTGCGQGFITGGKLNAHISKVHRKERKQVCSICNKRFFNNNFLRSHMAVHTEERNHNCNVCQASFKRRKTLLAHMKLHENKRQYECTICNERFNQRPALKAHLKRKHNSYTDSTLKMEEFEFVE